MAFTICNYGKTRLYKTSQAKFIAKYIWKKYRKRTRFITTDTGSLWEPVQASVDAEIIDPLFLPTDPAFNPQSALRKLLRGAWPVGYDRGGMCLKRSGQTKWKEWDAKDSEEIGAYVFESLSSIGSGVMRDLAEKNVTVGQGNVPGYRTEDGEVFGQNTETHYGMIQTAVNTMMNSIAVLPVELVYLTAWDEVIEPRDKDVLKVYKLGPMLPGRKLVDSVPGSVNILIHSTMVNDSANKSEVRYYIKPHPWEVLAKYSWPAGLRLEASKSIIAELDKKWPNGYFVPTLERGILDLLEFRDEMRVKAAEEARKELEV